LDEIVPSKVFAADHCQIATRGIQSAQLKHRGNLTMVTLNMRVNRAKTPEGTLGRIAAQSFGLYRSQFGPLFAWFLLPAAGRSLWMIAQR
jgi:hypothetical protein